MRASRFPQLWRKLHSSYWFIPSVMVVGALGLALVLRSVDLRIDFSRFESLGYLFDTKPEGARAILSAIAGSMITVAGVTFSMTLVAVAFAAAQAGPRLVGNMMRDTGNQVTLGVFIATFVYCLMVLRSVRSGDAGSAGFVPHLSILVALILTLACIGVLIYFIHHIPETIDIGNITASVGRQLQRDIKTVFPERLGEPPPSDAAAQSRDDLDNLFVGATAVDSTAVGYVQSVDTDRLMALASRLDLTLRLDRRPGDFVAMGDTLLHATADPGTHQEELRACFAVGIERTPGEDVLFLVDELTEIMIRALSPGVNDPFTARTCMHWLCNGLVEASKRQAPSALRYDQNGELRVVAEPFTFEALASATFDNTRQYVCADRNAALEAMRAIDKIAQLENDTHRRAKLLAHADALLAGCLEQLPLDTDRKELMRRHAVLTSRKT